MIPKGTLSRILIILLQMRDDLFGTTINLDRVDWTQFQQYLETYTRRLENRLVKQGFAQEEASTIVIMLYKIKELAQKDQSYIFLNTYSSKLPGHLCIEYINEFIKKFNLAIIGQRKYTTKLPGYFRILNI